MKKKTFETFNDLENEDFICAAHEKGYTIYAYKGEKDDEINLIVLREPDQAFMCSGTILHIDGDIDCFVGDIDKNKVVMPIIKELVKHGYIHNEDSDN